MHCALISKKKCQGKAKIKLERLVMTNSTLKGLGKSRGSFKFQASKLSRVSFTSAFLLKPGSFTGPPAIDLNR
ncbi:unnamed protein product [Ilex paraguariensis]|uniref:Ribosomal protein L32 n=1 Tax=Ilex paraguariensis TaxID=185542 RepID=A0ABC8RFI2_9AQUA